MKKIKKLKNVSNNSLVLQTWYLRFGFKSSRSIMMHQFLFFFFFFLESERDNGGGCIEVKINRVVCVCLSVGYVAICATASYQIGPPNCSSMICTRVANYRFTPLLISFFFLFSSFFLLRAATQVRVRCVSHTHEARAIPLHN